MGTPFHSQSKLSKVLAAVCEQWMIHTVDVHVQIGQSAHKSLDTFLDDVPIVRERAIQLHRGIKCPICTMYLDLLPIRQHGHFGSW
jgi:hypothetical protein